MGMEPTASLRAEIRWLLGALQRGFGRAWRWAWVGRSPRHRAATLGLATGGVLAGLVAGAWVGACSGGCPRADQLGTLTPREASVVLDARGGVLGMFAVERRRSVPIGSLPSYVPWAFVAIEDRRFFAHEGIDPVRLVGAIRDNLFEGFGASGGSTITMQLARNLFPQQIPPREKSLRRKVAEIRLALLMERRFTKRRILELYLNHIYLGAGAYGIEAAARTYFDKPASQLTLAEAALLAGLPKAPSALNPRRNPRGAVARRNLVLKAMVEAGAVAPAQAQAAMREPLRLAPPRGIYQAPYVVEQVRRELENVFGDLLYTGGLRIHTSIDPELQAAAERELERQLEDIERGTFGPYPHPTYADLRARRGRRQLDLAQTPYLQGAVMALDPYTGDVLALVGGRDFQHSQFNRATQALRQPGSAFKPFVYAAAIEAGRGTFSRVWDTPFSLRLSDGTIWAPRNYDNEYGGAMTLRAALRLSRNAATIRLGREVGIARVRSVAQRAGIDTRIPAFPSVYIGAAAMVPLDLVAAYASFGNGGVRVEPRFVRRVEDRHGRLLWAPPPQLARAFDPAVAWILTDMLREVVDRGTGYLARDPAVGGLSWSIPAAGKTGTTNDATDVWFIGYTPDLLVGVWLGFDRPTPILPRGTGGTLAVPIWARIVQTYYDHRPPPEPWPRPPSVALRWMSTALGHAVPDHCPFAGGVYVDYFVASAAPEPRCEIPQPRTDLADPTPWLPGRPVVPGQPRVPRPEDILRPAVPPPKQPPS